MPFAASTRRCLIISGNEQNQVLNDTGWRFGQQPGTDLYSMHGYPVPAWHSVGFDGMTDPLCQSLLPFYTQIARAFGPVMVQEFGTIVTFGAEQQESYLRALLPACWQAGANGFLWWCLRDVVADVHPYLKHRFESTLGLVDDEDRVKPGLEFYVEFARSLQQRPLPARDDRALGQDDRHLLAQALLSARQPAQPGQRSAPALALAGDGQLFPAAAGLSNADRSRRPAAERRREDVAHPRSDPDALEVQALEAWVQAGGRLIWHGPDPVNWGHEYVRLLGARPVDYRAVRPVQVEAFGETWTLDAHPQRYARRGRAGCGPRRGPRSGRSPDPADTQVWRGAGGLCPARRRSLDGRGGRTTGRRERAGSTGMRGCWSYSRLHRGRTERARGTPGCLVPASLLLSVFLCGNSVYLCVSLA